MHAHTAGSSFGRFSSRSFSASTFTLTSSDRLPFACFGLCAAELFGGGECTADAAGGCGSWCCWGLGSGSGDIVRGPWSTSAPAEDPATVEEGPEKAEEEVAAAAEAAEARSSGDHTIWESTFCSGWGRSPIFTSIL